MTYDSRKHRRIELNYVAQILTAAAEPICDCALMDVSQGGARIAVLAMEMVPQEFLLRFSSTDVSRRCRVVWRKDDEIGVVFVNVDAAKLAKAARRARLLETPCP